MTVISARPRWPRSSSMPIGLSYRPATRRQERSAEALSGLARAFFYTGSRSLLVSHWYVASKTTVPLITTAIAMLTVDPKIGRAEALRRSMLSMIDTGNAYEVHPAFWAPFVLARVEQRVRS
jgi:CHAT domain-containing protein